MDGILLIDKPEGLTSHDVVDRLRKKLQMRQIGHAGTLDPMATGLLVMLVGRATKLSQQLMSADKVYEGKISLGATTDTYDATGKIMRTAPIDEIKLQDISASMAGFVGDQYQIPPMFSAKKVAGVPLYKMARKGQEIDREPRFIHISRFDILQYEAPLITFKMACSKGTYVRTVAHDLGEKLGCGAHLASLRRTTSGEHSVNDAITLEAFEISGIADIRRRLFM